MVNQRDYSEKMKKILKEGIRRCNSSLKEFDMYDEL